MALSNWDLLAWDEHVKPTNGVATNHLKTKVEIYKDWIYVHDQEMWVDGNRGYCEPIVAHIRKGEVNIAGWHIVAKRGLSPQSVYLYARSVNYDAKPQYVYLLAGIGCYAFDNITDEHSGVQEYMYEDFLHWLRTVLYDDEDDLAWLAKVIQAKPLRANQGDMYFDERLEIGSQATEIGKQEKPHILRMCEKERGTDANQETQTEKDSQGPKAK